jgi:hypothetical protein
MNTFFRIFMLALIAGILGYWFYDAQNPDFSTGECIAYAVVEAFFIGILVYATRRDRRKQEGL